MMPAIKSETRKLLTLRINYVLVVLALLGVILFACLSTIGQQTALSEAQDPQFLASSVTTAVGVVATFAALLAALQFTRDYRHNTIMSALTLSNSRIKVFVAKIVVMSCFAVLFTAVAAALAPALSDVVIHLHHGIALVPQTFKLGSLAWQTFFFGWAATMLGLVTAGLLRNQLGAVVTLLIFPTTVEPLLGLLLGDRGEYLPFNALFGVIGQSLTVKSLSPANAALVVMIYLVIGWIAAGILFIRRDAN